MNGSMESYLQDNSVDDLLEETRLRDERLPMEDYYRRVDVTDDDSGWRTGIDMGEDEDFTTDDVDDGELDDEEPDLADLPEERDALL